jgi:1-acyl-sn-glycerol-3-phosphate acyltransferase
MLLLIYITLLRFFAFLINNILVRMYHQGIHIKESEFLELRRVAEYCAEKKYSMVILPCHKSHIDYLVISYIFFRMGLALPHIAAGDNLDMPIVGKALKGAGAFFIRRSWADDQLYTSIVQEYVQELLEGGYNIECFIEGTRSRTGKLLPPKLGGTISGLIVLLAPFPSVHPLTSNHLLSFPPRSSKDYHGRYALEPCSGLLHRPYFDWLRQGYRNRDLYQ